MPTYEYLCGSCSNEWEAEQSIKDAPLTECPRCHAGTARRQISRGTGFILKGGGWYSDLYASSSNSSGSGGSGSSGGSKASSDSGGSGDSSSTSSASTSGASAGASASGSSTPSSGSSSSS